MLVGKSEDALLGSLIFAGTRNCIENVWSAGRHIVKEGQHVERASIANRFARFMQKLLD